MLVLGEVRVLNGGQKWAEPGGWTAGRGDSEEGRWRGGRQQGGQQRWQTAMVAHRGRARKETRCIVGGSDEERMPMMWSSAVWSFEYQGVWMDLLCVEKHSDAIVYGCE